MAGIHGTTVTLFEQKQTGVDAFGAPIYTETPIQVRDVLIGEPTVDEITTSTAMYGKKIVCMLGIPKGDKHNWVNKKVSWTSCGQTFTVQTFGFPITGIEANIPLRWHMKVRCEAYG
jgi:hypothetical protein